MQLLALIYSDRNTMNEDCDPTLYLNMVQINRVKF